MNVKLFSPHRGQKQIIDGFADSIHKFGIVATGRQFGKSLLAQNLMLYWLLQNPNQKGAWITPVYNQCRKIFQELTNAANSIITKQNKAELTIEFVNGSTLQFLSTDNYNTIRGFSFNYVVIDEAAFVKQDAIEQAVMPTLTAIGSVLKITFGIVGAIWNVFMAILKPVFAIAGAIMENISEPLRMASDALQPLFAKFAQLKDKVMAAVTPILPVFKFIGVLLGTIIGGAIDVLVGAFSAGFDIIFSIIEGVSDFFQKYLVAPLQWVIDNVSSVFSSIGSFLGFGGDSETPAAAASTSMGTTPTESVNDGVVQKGKVVGTDPADTLLATKDPGSLLETIATGLGTGIGGLLGGLMGGGRDDTAIIGKLDELIMAVQSNRDVYMDKEKVSSAVVKTNEKSGENRFGLMGA